MLLDSLQCSELHPPGCLVAAPGSVFSCFSMFPQLSSAAPPALVSAYTLDLENEEAERNRG